MNSTCRSAPSANVPPVGLMASTFNHALNVCTSVVAGTTVFAFGVTLKQYNAPGLTCLMVSLTPSAPATVAFGPVNLSASCDAGKVTHTPPVTGSVPPVGSGSTLSMKLATTSVVSAASLYACT